MRGVTLLRQHAALGRTRKLAVAPGFGITGRVRTGDVGAPGVAGGAQRFRRAQARRRVPVLFADNREKSRFEGNQGPGLTVGEERKSLQKQNDMSSLVRAVAEAIPPCTRGPPGSYGKNLSLSGGRQPGPGP